LLGAAQARREAAGAPLPIARQPAQDRLLAELRAVSGDGALRAALEAGCVLSWEQFLAEALPAGSPPFRPVRQIARPKGVRPVEGRPLLARGDLTAEEWRRLAPLLPASDGRRGRPYQDHRQVINGIFWVLRTGAGWRDLPERYGRWHTCHDRFLRWRRQGLWDRLVEALEEPASAVS